MTSKKNTTTKKSTWKELVEKLQQLWKRVYADEAIPKCFVPVRGRSLSEEVWYGISDKWTDFEDYDGLFHAAHIQAQANGYLHNASMLWDDESRFIQGKDAIKAAQKIIQEVRSDDLIRVGWEEGALAVEVVKIRDLTCQELQTVIDAVEAENPQVTEKEDLRRHCRDLLNKCNLRGLKAVLKTLESK